MNRPPPTSVDTAGVILTSEGVWRCSAKLARTSTQLSTSAPQTNSHVRRRFIDPILRKVVENDMSGGADAVDQLPLLSTTPTSPVMRRENAMSVRPSLLPS